MIEIEHFRSKLDVLFHVLISSFWLQTKISWFSARKFRGLFFEHLKLNFRPSIFFSFSPDPKNLRNFKTRPATKWRYYWGSFYLRQITCQNTVPDLIEPDSQCCSVTTAWNWLQLLANGRSCNANKAVFEKHGWNSNFTLFSKTLSKLKNLSIHKLLVLNVESPILDRYKEFACSRINSC